MSAIFCSSCGMKHTYQYAVPKFCSGCGSSLGAVMQTAPKKTVAKASKEEDDDVDDDLDDEVFSDSDYVPNIRKIQVEVETASNINTFTLGSILNQKSDGTQNEPFRRSSRARSVDDFVNEKPRSGKQ